MLVIICLAVASVACLMILATWYIRYMRGPKTNTSNTGKQPMNVLKRPKIGLKSSNSKNLYLQVLVNPVYQNLRMIISLIWSTTILSTEVDNFGVHKIFILLVLNTLCWTNTGLIHNKVSNKKSLLGKFKSHFLHYCVQSGSWIF